MIFLPFTFTLSLVQKGASGAVVCWMVKVEIKLVFYPVSKISISIFFSNQKLAKVKLYIHPMKVARTWFFLHIPPKRQIFTTFQNPSRTQKLGTRMMYPKYNFHNLNPKITGKKKKALFIKICIWNMKYLELRVRWRHWIGGYVVQMKIYLL